jgi:hypothetical protein
MTEALGHEALQGIVLEAMRSPQPAQALVKAAIDSGSRDNVSVQFIRVGQNNTGSAPKVRESAKGPRGFWRRMLGKRARG